MSSLLPQVFYTVWCLSKSYTYENNCKKQLVGKKKRKKLTAQIRSNGRAHLFNAGLLA
jgi:hypothetical protein